MRDVRGFESLGLFEKLVLVDRNGECNDVSIFSKEENGALKLNQGQDFWPVIHVPLPSLETEVGYRNIPLDWDQYQ